VLPVYLVLTDPREASVIEMMVTEEAGRVLGGMLRNQPGKKVRVVFDGLG
jgi:hypothetical protein